AVSAAARHGAAPHAARAGIYRQRRAGAPPGADAASEPAARSLLVSAQPPGRSWPGGLGRLRPGLSRPRPAPAVGFRPDAELLASALRGVFLRPVPRQLSAWPRPRLRALRRRAAPSAHRQPPLGRA